GPFPRAISHPTKSAISRGPRVSHPHEICDFAGTPGLPPPRNLRFRGDPGSPTPTKSAISRGPRVSHPHEICDFAGTPGLPPPRNLRFRGDPGSPTPRNLRFRGDPGSPTPRNLRFRGDPGSALLACALLRRVLRCSPPHETHGFRG